MRPSISSAQHLMVPVLCYREESQPEFEQAVKPGGSTQCEYILKKSKNLDFWGSLFPAIPWCSRGIYDHQAGDDLSTLPVN